MHIELAAEKKKKQMKVISLGSETREIYCNLIVAKAQATGRA